MGIRLVVEVLDHAPAGLTAAERLLLVVLAEEARDATRQAYPGREVLLRRTGLGVRGLRYALERLASRGLEVRVPIGTDAVGRPLYAFAGQRTIYRLPEFSAGNGGTTVPPNGGTRNPPMGEPEVRDGGTTVPPMGEPEVPPLPHRSLSPSAAVPRETRETLPAHIETIRKATGADAGEAQAVAELIAREKTPENLTGFVRRLAGDGELGGWLARVREDRARAEHADFRASLAAEPECEHGVAGGHIHSPTGWVACPQERRRLAKGGRR